MEQQSEGSNSYSEDLKWADLFNSCEVDPFHGFVVDNDQFKELRWHYEVQSKAHFVAVKTSSSFGKTEFSKKHHKIQWRSQDCPYLPNCPYIVLSVERYECHHGPDRNKTKKEKTKLAKKVDHSYQKKKRFHNQSTKKMDCPATIVAKEMLLFTDYEGLCSKWKREQISKEIRRKMAEEEKNVVVKRQIFVALPKETDHRYHLQGEVEDISMPVDKRIVAKIEEFVGDGFISSSSIRLLVEQFVRKELFPNQKCPPWTNRRFFPTQRDILNIVYSARMKAMKSKYDQENLQSQIQEWTRDSTDDFVMFNGDAASEETTNGFLFIYQSSWQRRLLNLYGNELCLLDATYRTTKYAIPLFFLCVKTNVDYCVVAIFASQYENSHTIATALKKIKEWNPDWNPQHFMVDHCEAEINAINTCFKECQIFICDFHREQAWSRWLKASKHGLNKDIDEVLPLLRSIARASTKADHDNAISALRSSQFWTTNKEFRDWIWNTWLKNVEMWAWVYRKDRLLVKVNTNNGVERQNRTLKYDFLTRFTDRSLTGMLTTVIKRYLPDQYRKYMDVNIKASAQYKKYNNLLPAFLHNRPKEFIEHCKQRFVREEEVAGKIVKGEGVYTVQSFTGNRTTYIVSLGSDETSPSCQCHDWAHTHWPCKHILAVVMHFPETSWNDIPNHYRNNPMFILDQLCLQDIGFQLKDECNDLLDSSADYSSTKNVTASEEEPFEDQAKPLTTTRMLREELEQIKALSYLEVKTEILEKVLKDLIKIREKLYNSVPSDANIPLTESDSTVKSAFKAPFNICKRKKKLSINKTTEDKRVYKELPLRKRKTQKESVHHVARKIDQIDEEVVQQHFQEEVLQEIISGTAYLEETPNDLSSNLITDKLCQDADQGHDQQKKKIIFSVPPAPIIQPRRVSCEPVEKKMKLKLKLRSIPPIPEKKVRFSKNCKTTSDHKVLVKPKKQKRKMDEITNEVKKPVEKKMKLKLKLRSIPPIPEKKDSDNGFADECKIDKSHKLEILPKLADYVKMMSKEEWNDMIVKAQYIESLTGKRAAAAIDLATDDPAKLLFSVRNHLPVPVTEHNLVNILFKIIAKMVDDGYVTIPVDPKHTDQAVDEAMTKLSQCFGKYSDNTDKKEPPEADTEEKFIDELTKGGLYRKSSYMLTKNSGIRYDVQGEILEGTDLRTLEGSNWLNDKVINAYFGILKNEQNLGQNGHVFVLPSYMAVLWGRRHLDTWFYKKVNMSRYTWIFLPININENHWILLAANVPNMTVSILDSMNGFNNKYIGYWRKYMKLRSQQVGELGGEWTVGKLHSSRQQDGSSCGPFVLLNALALSKGIDPLLLTQKCALVMRRHVTSKILQAAKKPKAQRSICDIVDCKKPNKDNWVQCEVCGRWIHFACAHINQAPRNDFVCVICNAQYD